MPPVPLAVPAGVLTTRPGIVLARDACLRTGAAEADGLVLSRPEAAVAFEVCHAGNLTDAVAMIDRAAAADLVSLAELQAFAGRSGRASVGHPPPGGHRPRRRELLVADGDGDARVLEVRRDDRCRKDVRREGAFRRLGMEYVEMVTADVADPSDFLRLSRSRFRSKVRGSFDRFLDLGATGRRFGASTGQNPVTEESP